MLNSIPSTARLLVIGAALTAGAWLIFTLHLTVVSVGL